MPHPITALGTLRQPFQVKTPGFAQTGRARGRGVGQAAAMVDLSSFTPIDLSRLPAPKVIEPLNYEAMLAEMKSEFQARCPEFSAMVESDPVMRALEVCAYMRLIDRQRVNDAAQAVLLSHAQGPDLDALGALFGVARLLIDAGDAQAGRAETWEGDASLRQRIALAPEGYSVAGPEGAYVYHALSAHPDIVDASAISPEPGRVVVTVMARAGDGTPTPQMIAAVAARLNDKTVRPMTDQVTVAAAAVVPFQVTAQLRTFAGPDAAVVLAEARRRLDDELARGRRLGHDVTRSALIAALHCAGVQNVALIHPAADIVIDRTSTGWCEAVSVAHVGTGE